MIEGLINFDTVVYLELSTRALHCLFFFDFSDNIIDDSFSSRLFYLMMPSVLSAFLS